MPFTETGHPALTDERTGLPNKLQFETVYRFLFAAADRGVPLALMLIHLDVTEESAFRGAAARLAASTRGSDLLAHLGDGRFVTILFGCNLHGARVAADRMSTVLADEIGGRFAVGMAAYRDGMKQPSELMDAASRAVDDAWAAGGGSEIGIA